MPRIGASVALLALAASTLAACPQPTLPILALGRTADGRPVAHLHTCEPYQPGLQLRTDPADRFGDIVWRINRTVRHGGPETVELGAVPEGWAAQPADPFELLPDVRYRLDAFVSPPATPLTFTLADLEALEPGQVRTTRPMSRDEFDKAAAKAC